MNFNLLTKITQLLRSKQRRGRWLKAVSCMAAVVVFCTTYALILPAITMTATCGLEEHTHTAACYANDDTLIWLCQQEEQETAVHQHDETCYDENGLLTCGIADFVLHTHDADTCYDAEGNLICTLPEITSYSKTTLFLTANGDDANYEDSENVWVSTPSSLQFDLFTVEGAEDTELFLPDGYTVLDSQETEVWTETHTHSADCYDQDGKLICGQLEVAQHQHTMECLQGTLICGLEEHQHSQDCYASAKETYLCGLEEHQHEEACYDEEGNLICTLEEHVHTEACLASKDQQEEETEQTLTTQVDDATISVTFPTDALPEGVILQAQEIAQDSDDYAAYYQQALQAMQNQAEMELTLSFARFFDITFLADGAEVEPTAPVAVTITYADGIALAGNESSGAVHFAADDIQVLDVQIEGSEDTIDAFTFTQDSFSVTGTVLALDASSFAVEVAVGETLEITGTAANYHSWSSGDASIAMILGSSAAATVTGKAAGVTTITHIYGKNKNNISTETFTLIVTAAEEETELKASGNGFTVKVTGNKNKLPDDVELVVEEVAANYGDDSYDDSYYNAMIDGLNEAEAATTTLQHGSEHATTDFDFLHLYHIWLRQADGTEYTLSEADNLNLNVTITYTETETPEGWESLKANGAWVGHYKKENGSIVAKSIAETGIASTLTPKNIKVKGNSISFHIKSFSTFPVAALAAQADTELEVTPSNVAQYLVTFAANAWQIVAEGYEGNSAGNKVLSSDGTVRVQKNVIPTNTENEFLVYLSIDTKQLFEEYFQVAEYEATTSNNYHDKDLGTVVLAMTGNQNVHVTGDSSAGYLNSAQFTIKDHTGKVLAENVRLYWSQANNVTFYLKTSSEKYILMGLSIKKNDNETVQLSEEAETYIRQEVAQAANLKKVTDQMGDYVEFVEVVGGDYETEPTYDSDGKTLTWIPSVKTNAETAEETNGTVITAWSLNVAELVYRVRLTTEKGGFNSCADNMESDIGDEESYKVNQSATLNYGDSQTVDFPVPYVRGLRYNLSLKKVDKDDVNTLLEGAEFEIAGQTNAVKGSAIATTSAEGIAKFTDLIGPDGEFNGIFTLTETEAPEGYQLLNEPITCSIPNYTQSPDLFVVDDKNMLYNPATPITIENKKCENVFLKKVSTDDKPIALKGAEFKLYKIDKDDEGNEIKTEIENTSGNSFISAENGMLTTSALQLEDGTYHLIETKAPDGYHPLTEPVVITVNDNGVSAMCGTSSLKVESSSQDDDDTTTYTILVTNSTGTALPETGGTGSEAYQLAGLLLMLTAAIWLWKQKQLRERGNVHSPKA